MNPFSSQIINELLTGDQLDINHLESTLNDIMPSFFSLHYPESNRLLLIHSFTEIDRDTSLDLWKKELEFLINFFQKKSDLDLYLGMGSLQDSKMQLFDSFAKARQALNTQIRSHEPGIGEFDADEMQGGLELPKNIFTTLETYIFQEDLQGIDTVFRNLEKILFDPSLSFVLKQYLITTIYGQVMDMSARIGKTRLLNWSPDFFGKINTNEGIRKIFFQLQEKTHFISAQNTTIKRSHNSKLLDGILNEIQNNLSNCNVNAAMIAEKCGITETYLYQFFKEQTGQTFAVYMEKRRIEKARDLLLNSQFTIGEIALMAGYSSSNTFGRAFKRNQGYSAGKYRENRGKTE
jgi:two-component system response regulator YesN